MMLDLAIVIVNYNTSAELADCLQSVRDSQLDYTYRVVVVDNDSTDGSVARVRREHPWVHAVIETGRNGGYAFANNQGLRSVGFGCDTSLPRYTLLLNPDTILPAEALQVLIGFMDESPDVGVVGPRLVRCDGSLDKACRRSFPSPLVSFYHLSGLDRLFPNSPRLARYNMTFLDESEQADVDSVVGAFMLMRSTALQEAGLLDESFFMYGEDLDLCYRIKEHGWRIVYNPVTTVLHVKGAASRKASTRSILAFYDAMRIFHDKHYRSRTPLPVNWAISGAISLLRWGALIRDRSRPPERKRVASS